MISSFTTILALFSLGFQFPMLLHGFTGTQQPAFAHRRSTSQAAAVSTTALSAEASQKSLVVISPPGGVGEVAAVRAGSMGMDVRWFVVSSAAAAGAGQQQQQQLVLSQYALDEIETAGGKVDVAGAEAGSLLLSADDPESSINAVSTWCGFADSILCTFDGMDQILASVNKGMKKKKFDDVDPKEVWKDAIKVAAREASSKVSGTKIAVLAATEKEPLPSESSDGASSGGGGGLGGLVGNLIGGKRISIPASLSEAMGGSAAVTKLRHGELFGTPESSPEFSPLVGGPRRQPELCEEYTMRTVRVDPTLSVAGNLMMGSNTRSSRHAVGEAAALMASGKVPTKGLDVCVSSQRGADIFPLELWEKEFERVQQTVASTSGKDGAPQLFTAEFSSVPSVERLADWLATKWAPAVLRTYDIAAIRTGARPVYANRVGNTDADAGTGTVEIVWQQLVNFESVTVGRMSITVSDTGLVATRGPGDSAKGFGSVSRAPLAGEDVLVRRLAEAVSQAIEKGLAKKPLPAKQPSTATTTVEVARPAASPPPPVEVAPPPVTTIQASGTVPETSSSSSSEQGPRQAGARRSRERQRGTKRSRKSDPPPS